MRSLFFFPILAFWALTATAETIGTGGSIRHAHSAARGGSCNGTALGAFAKAGAPGTVSHLKCRVSVEAALRKAGCHIPLGGPQSFANVSKVWHNCGHSTSSAPNGAVMMYSRRGGTDRHYEIKYHGCYYSDFHHRECLPATQFHSGPFKLIGWCAP